MFEDSGACVQVGEEGQVGSSGSADEEQFSPVEARAELAVASMVSLIRVSGTGAGSSTISSTISSLITLVYLEVLSGAVLIFSCFLVANRIRWPVRCWSSSGSNGRFCLRIAGLFGSRGGA